MAYNTNVETKWNADNEKMAMIIDLETNLSEAFANYDYSAIYTLLRVYRLNTDPKFGDTDRTKLANELSKISILFSNLKEKPSDENAKQFMLKSEDFFLKISRALKEAGIYFREGKSAQHAILER